MKNTLTFEQIIQQARAHIVSISENKIEELIKQLDHGKGILTSNEQLDMYLLKYGDIHQAKLIQAFEHIPHKLWTEGSISIVDYGCGQGIAEMVLSDFLQSRNIDNDIIKDITLNNTLPKRTQVVSEIPPFENVFFSVPCLPCKTSLLCGC